MSDEFKLEGDRDVVDAFRALEQGMSVRYAAREMTGALISALQVYVAAVKAGARRLSDSVPLWRRRQWPTDPLHAADAVRAQWARGDAGEVAATAGVPRTHFWALFLEYGTKWARAFPFLRPAWVPADVLDGVAAALRSRLDRLTARLARKAAA